MICLDLGPIPAFSEARTILNIGKITSVALAPIHTTNDYSTGSRREKFAINGIDAVHGEYICRRGWPQRSSYRKQRRCSR